MRKKVSRDRGQEISRDPGQEVTLRHVVVPKYRYIHVILLFVQYRGRGFFVFHSL